MTTFAPLSEMPMPKPILEKWIEQNGMPSKLPDMKFEIAEACAIFDEFLSSKFPNEVLTSNLRSSLVQQWLEIQRIIGENLYVYPNQYDGKST